MKDINDFVVINWAPQWKQLGRLLKIDQNSINILEHNHGNDCVKCCTRMLEAWQEENIVENTTWEILICAINNLPIDLRGAYIANITAIVCNVKNSI